MGLLAAYFLICECQTSQNNWLEWIIGKNVIFARLELENIPKLCFHEPISSFPSDKPLYKRCKKMLTLFMLKVQVKDLPWEKIYSKTEHSYSGGARLPILAISYVPILNS